MKQIKEIQSEIDELIKEASQKPEKQVDYAKFKRRKKVISTTIKSLRFLIAYLETNPSEDLIKSQKTSVDRKMIVLMTGADHIRKKLRNTKTSRQDTGISMR